MKKSELKAIIKETVKECIHEVLMENKVFSSMISEVIKQTKNIVLESSGAQVIQSQTRPQVAQLGPSRYKEISENMRQRDTYAMETPRREILNEYDSESRYVKKEVEEENLGDVYGAAAYGKIAETAENCNVIPADTIAKLMGFSKI
jgi:hypothetical protein